MATNENAASTMSPSEKSPGFALHELHYKTE
jgi:hypothetical protein